MAIANRRLSFALNKQGPQPGPLCSPSANKEERHPAPMRFGAFPAMTDMIFFPDATIAFSPLKRLSLSLSLSL
jgi:hypothetical protein